MTKPEHQKLFDDLLEIARQSADELADRAKALAYDIASRIGDDEEENAAQRAEAEAARARADETKKKYEAGLTAMDAQLKDATQETRQQVRQLADVARTEAAKVAEQARANAEQMAREIQASAEKAKAEAAKQGQNKQG
ncbi:hypothetical protein ACINK0_10100 [Deinococcus sp. VB343]|uniref:hypothetical protein n=1 Tax=Deinococcus sp. VB343 TaxID=3385567 RepID=UPI0039C8D068